MTPPNDTAGLSSPDTSEIVVADCTARKFPGAPLPRKDGFQVVIRQSVMNSVREHAHSSLKAEICGVLVGDVYRDDQGPFVYVEAAIRGEFAASQLAGVTFTAETWTHMQGVLDKEHPGKKIVGWYHSHPDFGVFLSEMDLFIHRHFFNLPWQLALVCDPIRSEDGLFVWKKGQPEQQPFLTEQDVPSIQHSLLAEVHQAAVDDGRSLNREMANVRQNVRWLTAGMILTFVVSVIWPAVLVRVSGRRVPPPEPPAISLPQTRAASEPPVKGTEEAPHARPASPSPSSKGSHK